MENRLEEWGVLVGSSCKDPLPPVLGDYLILEHGIYGISQAAVCHFRREVIVEARIKDNWVLLSFSPL